MNKKEKELIGALIGLAKACNVHLKTENTDNIIIQSLAGIFQNEQQLEELLQKVREEKFAVAPDCATCLNPCGNTDEFNLDELWNPEISQNVRNLKIELLQVSYKLAFEILNGNIKNTERKDMAEWIYDGKYSITTDKYSI